MKFRQIAFTIACASVVLSGATTAQDFNKSPSFGSTSLEAGFTPDPYTVSLSSGGNIEADNLGGDCAGYIADAPDYRLNYDAGSLSLTISVSASVDTTLVINTPNGNWVCDDDSGGNLDPKVTFSKPSSGQYDIWVGTYGNSSMEPAVLQFTELD